MPYCLRDGEHRVEDTLFHSPWPFADWRGMDDAAEKREQIRPVTFARLSPQLRVEPLAHRDESSSHCGLITVSKP